MTGTEREIAAYESMKGELEESHPGKFVWIKNEKLAGIFDTLEEAANTALSESRGGTYIVQQVGTDSIILPAEAHDEYLRIKKRWDESDDDDGA